VQELIYSSHFPELTHYAFRFPAKFHPGVARALLHEYGARLGWTLDPFCGSGTLLVEARVASMNAVGSDIDPLAVFVSRAKTQRYRPSSLRRYWERLSDKLARVERSADTYEQLQFLDISDADYFQEISNAGLEIPPIPNLFHWFRRYVIVDLANILRTIMSTEMPRKYRDFFLLCFAAIIRASSNADPVPVSGLEVTAYMRKRDAEGRIVNPFELFRKAVSRNLTGATEFWEVSDPRSSIQVRQVDATKLAAHFRRTFDSVITSPPYHSAVDYYRRHQLEMFWLGLTNTQAERLKLLPQYIGRPRVRKGDHFATKPLSTPMAQAWEQAIRARNPARAVAFRHYVNAMIATLNQLANRVRPGGRLVMVVGHSTWNGEEIPTTDLMRELAQPAFRLDHVLSYGIKNRYMSYSRHNGANIDREYVLVFNR